jgi:Bacterial DNA-binding protein
MVWRVIDEPGVGRYLLSRFPYALYYRWHQERDRVSIYAVFGKLVKQKRKARTGFNPKTQQKIKIPAKTVIN